MWQLDADTADVVMQTLIAAGFLHQIKNGMFVRTDVGR